MDEEIGSYELFVANRAQALLRYGYVLTGNPHDAADLMQEALLRLRTAWPRVHNKREPELFVRTTMARLHVSIWRRMRREKLVAATPEQAYVDNSHEKAELRDAMWEALSALPRRQRAVVVLRYYECLTDEEIADVLNISRGTVRSQAARALDKLRTRVTGPADLVDAGTKEGKLR
ncbi:RNA polymerase sigma-70 factor, sigma-E family [Actinopolymorpha cephalotaxi]|uniref:RNA polymerase sigma-70 factor (Sigma-E family) n=1 Tax=Actinopolymorpha cephalotaxi TaxID=504797 RepID=A0A1I2KDG0_9ACTN|nr:SigE family RNA polymerase sigma factor [Actinopolymorpha cephalotaxi]NYH87353.1 RNA polymerase sigma-70 factor (sigma-E family) [Actinopolymorpha cephalotaxi]SFF65014.1 RNA polymerase sigma-70 factor, sigma-E family [Actinopolymorpha cephalotaxi]